MRTLYKLCTLDLSGDRRIYRVRGDEYYRDLNFERGEGLAVCGELARTRIRTESYHGQQRDLPSGWEYIEADMKPV